MVAPVIFTLDTGTHVKVVLAGIISVPSFVGLSKKEASLQITCVLFIIVEVGLTVTFT